MRIDSPLKHMISRTFLTALFQKSTLTLFVLLSISSWSHANRIDIMIIYTPQVTATQGSHNGVSALVQSMVAGANQTFADSGVNITLNLVYSQEVDFVETPGNMGADLQALRNPNDGVLDEVHALRSDWGADLVCLLVAGSGGIAYLLQNPSGNETIAFSVVGQTGAVMVFTHEIGHNLGAEHDRQTAAGSSGLFSYSYGYRFVGNNAVQYRTIMAYDPGVWIPRFSNPLQHYQGHVLGQPEGHAESADNARTLNLATPVVASYRDEVPATPVFTVTPENLRAIVGTQQALQVQVLGSPPLSVQWYQGSPGDTSTPFSPNRGQGLEVTVSTGIQNFWVQASNNDGTVQSAAVTIEGMASWQGDTAIDQSQTSGNTYFSHNLANRYWQEWVPSMPYLDSVQLHVVKVGSGNSFVFRLLDANDLVLCERNVPVSSTGWVTIPIGRWVQPGRTYRLELIPGDNTSNYVTWLFSNTDNPYPAGRTSFSGSYSLDFDFVFRTIGGSNTAPTLTPIGNRTIQAGQTLTITILADDPDGDELQYSATGGE